jgi:hypothetical protein
MYVERRSDSVPLLRALASYDRPVCLGARFSGMFSLVRTGDLSYERPAEVAAGRGKRSVMFAKADVASGPARGFYGPGLTSRELRLYSIAEV